MSNISVTHPHLKVLLEEKEWILLYYPPYKEMVICHTRKGAHWGLDYYFLFPRQSSCGLCEETIPPHMMILRALGNM